MAAGGVAGAGAGLRRPPPRGGHATPYGLYDLSRHAGEVTVGSDHDTAPFVVAAIRR